MLALNIVQVVIAVLLMISVMLQNKGQGLSGVFGGESEVFTTRRGFDKVLYYATIVLAVLFVGLAIVNLVFFG